MRTSHYECKAVRPYRSPQLFQLCIRRRENEYTAEQKVCCPELRISGRHAGVHDPGLHRGLDLPPGTGCGRQRHQRRRHGAGTSGHPVPEHDVLHRGAHGVFVHCRVCGHHEEPQTGRQDHGHHRADLRHHRRHRCRHHDRHYEDLPPGAGALEQPDRGRGGGSHLHPGPDRELLHRRATSPACSAAAPCCP